MAGPITPHPGAAAFLAAHGWGDAVIAPLAGDASFRRYFRITATRGRAVLMDAPPSHEDAQPFILAAQWLVERSFHAPRTIAADMDRGLVLIEDFGDARFRESVEAAPDTERPSYRAAVDLLVRLHAVAPGPFPAYDRAVYQREAGLFPDWYAPAVGLFADTRGFRAAWDRVLPLVVADPPVTVLRDYHAENIMLLDDGRLGLLDFQDALVGHPAYDLVSLLQDARRDVDAALEADMLAHYRTATGAGDAFDAAYHVLGAQRNAKILGIFTRLWRRDGKPRYPALCPRVWRYLERDLAHPALEPVRAWFDANVPADRRGDPMAIGTRT